MLKLLNNLRLDKSKIIKKNWVGYHNVAEVSDSCHMEVCGDRLSYFKIILREILANIPSSVFWETGKL